MKKIAVLGTGMAGFGAAHILHSEGLPFTCYDRNSYFGGHTYSFRYDSGFVFDEGGHISFTKNERVRDLLANNIEGKYEEPQLQIDNYWQGRRVTHPLQANLHGLPTSLIIDIIKDYVEVRNSDPNQSTNYADWLRAAYGKTFAETFPMGYGLKYHTTTMDQLSTDWIGPRMYRPDLDEMLHGALEGQRETVHYVDQFRYPSHGGFMTYLEAFASRYPIQLNHEVIDINPITSVISFSNGSTAEYSHVISSIPLPDLIPLIDDVPQDVLDASRNLAFTTAVLINLGIDRDDLSDTHITYFYDEDIIMSRVNLPHMFSPNNAPKGCGTIQAEVYFSDKYKPMTGRPEYLAEPVISDLRKCGFIRETDQILLQDVAVNRYANIIFDHERSPSLEVVHGYLQDIDIRYCGRYGNWDHTWTDEAFLSGEAVAQKLIGGAGA